MRPTKPISIAMLIACGCSSSALDEAAVCGDPPALAVPILLSGTSQEPLHWRANRCVTVTYDALSAARLADLQAALDAWAGIGCNSLCFTRPAASTTPIDRDDHRMHFFVSGPMSLTSTFYIEATGRIRATSVDIGSATTYGELVRQVGHALGLGRPAHGTDSVLAPDFVLAANSAPTALDAQAMCALYGRPALCEP